MNTIKRIWELFLRFARFLVTLWQKRKLFNRWMSKRYTPRLVALIATVACLVIASVALFVGPYLGVANDSLGNMKMQQYALSYREADMGEDAELFASNEYFTRQYVLKGTRESIQSSQDVVVRLAIALDFLFTSDGLFDVRFLAAVYLIAYLPAVYLVLSAAMERVSYFSEAVVLCVLGTLIFADISYVAFFNSLYIDPLILICLMYITGASMKLHLQRNAQIAFQIVLFCAGVVLCLLESRFFLAGVLVAVVLVSQMRIADSAGKIVSGTLAAVLIVVSVFSLYWSGDSFDEISHLHALTRGVLLQSENPDDTLEEMGIDTSFSVLTDQSLYSEYPVTETSNPVLRRGLLEKYDALDVAVYYLRHPGDLVSMWNNAISSALRLRRDYCGNYERSTGMPAMGKSLFFSMWSMFRERSLPSTIGYLALLIIVFSAMSGRKVFNRRLVQRWDYAYFITMMGITAIGVADITAVICLSGDAQLVQCSMTFGVVLDLLFYFIVAEILHKLNILEGKNEKD